MLQSEHFICFEGLYELHCVRLLFTLFVDARCRSHQLTKLKHDVPSLDFIRCLIVNNDEWICLSFCRSLSHYFPTIGGSKKRLSVSPTSHSALQRYRGGWAVPRVAVILEACTPTQRYLRAYKLSHAGRLGNALLKSWQCPDHSALMFSAAAKPVVCRHIGSASR